MFKILVINPGSTSTKLAVYEDKKSVWQFNVRHSIEDLDGFPDCMEQYDYRKSLIQKTLADNQMALHFDAVIGRGGLMKPLHSGVYEINKAMKTDLINATHRHACNLGCLIAADLASEIKGCKAFTADPVVVDEMSDDAHISGLPIMPHLSIFHALNHRATAMKYAESRGVSYEELNLIVCHLGGGISIAAHQHGRIIDVNNALDGEGPFSPERSGSLPAGQLVDLCFSGKLTKPQVMRLIAGRGGLVAHLGINDMEEAIDLIEADDEHAMRVVHAMVYGIAKEIGAKYVALGGRVDAILLTGGIAHSTYTVTLLRKMINFLAPIAIFPGENEMEALAFNAYRALSGEQEIRRYV